MTALAVLNFAETTKSLEEEIYTYRIGRTDQSKNDTLITLDQGESKGARQGQSHNSEAGPDGLLDRKQLTKIPEQMSHAIERMEGEGKSKGEFERDLGSKGQSAKRSGERRGLEMPSEQRRHEV